MLVRLNRSGGLVVTEDVSIGFELVSGLADVYRLVTSLL